MSFSQGQTTIFKQNLLNGLENFTSGTYKIALYTSVANLDNTTTAYTTTGEVSGSGYTAGGQTLVNIPPSTAFTIDNNFVSHILPPALSEG